MQLEGEKEGKRITVKLAKPQRIKVYLLQQGTVWRSYVLLEKDLLLLTFLELVYERELDLKTVSCPLTATIRLQLEVTVSEDEKEWEVWIFSTLKHVIVV